MVIKQVIIVPTYLGMSRGKIASQCCHAAVEARNRQWMVGKRIILRADTSQKVSALWKKAGKFEGWLFERFKITDAEPTTEGTAGKVTAVSFVGYEEDVDEVTGGLKLL